MSQSEFLSILDMRLDELDDKHRADLIGRALNIMLNHTRWRDRVENLKKAWSEVHTRQEMKRREVQENNPCPGDCDVCYKKNCLERRCEPDE